MKAPQRASEMAPVAVESVALGMRFQPRFELLDHSGVIVDRILRSQGSPFGPDTFPGSHREPGGLTLLNVDTKALIRLTDKDAILEKRIDSRNLGKVQSLGDSFSIYVLDNLKELLRLKDIMRYGILFRLAECRSALEESPIEHFLARDSPDSRSLSLRFTRRLPSYEALARKDVQDYRNVIYSIDQSESGEVKLLIDYQEYFEPPLNRKEWDKKPFPEFVARGLAYFSGEFQNWLARLSKADEAA